ncbi:hypothetical protein HAX54_011218 [Datura stramonium]|uniref:Uncharacterized protein n=1 Tax=Datura stramonium TaxID=4076 RepID=A0ABS8TJE4_DATST|nr:hypothetical protein [Datura stramonium]
MRRPMFYLVRLNQLWTCLLITFAIPKSHSRCHILQYWLSNKQPETGVYANFFAGRDVACSGHKVRSLTPSRRKDTLSSRPQCDTRNGEIPTSHSISVATHFQLRLPLHIFLMNCWAPALVDLEPSLAVEGVLGGSRVIIQLNLQRRSSRVSACWPPSSEVASIAFVGTAAVLPLYTIMVVAPKGTYQKSYEKQHKFYIVLGLLYCVSVIPLDTDTIQLMFASNTGFQRWVLNYIIICKNCMVGILTLPSIQLPGIAKMFSNEVTLASAWIHLLAIDLFAARQVYQDGLQNDIETRHSVSLCLLFCPVGILTHFITKALTSSHEERQRGTH